MGWKLTLGLKHPVDAILERPRYFFSVYAELSDPQLLAWHLVLSLEFYSTRNLAASSNHSSSSDWRGSCMMVREKTSARRNFLAACIARSFARSQPRPRIALPPPPQAAQMAMQAVVVDKQLRPSERDERLNTKLH